VIAVDGKGISAEAFTVFPELAGPASAEWGVADFFAVAVHSCGLR